MSEFVTCFRGHIKKLNKKNQIQKDTYGLLNDRNKC